MSAETFYKVGDYVEAKRSSDNGISAESTYIVWSADSIDGVETYRLEDFCTHRMFIVTVASSSLYDILLPA